MHKLTLNKIILFYINLVKFNKINIIRNTCPPNIIILRYNECSANNIGIFSPLKKILSASRLSYTFNMVYKTILQPIGRITQHALHQISNTACHCLLHYPVYLPFASKKRLRKQSATGIGKRGENPLTWRNTDKQKAKGFG